MSDDTVWKRRFLVFSLVRLSGLLLLLGGVGIALGDFVRPGGWPLPGALLVMAGLIEILVVPRILKRRWESR